MADSLKVLTLTKNLTIDRAADIKVALLDALAESDHVLVNTARATKVDLTFIHLLYAAARSAKQQGKELHLTSTASEALRDAVLVGGFCKDAPADARALERGLFEFPRSASEDGA
jgi:anti-anti-sigma regulatory factor